MIFRSPGVEKLGRTSSMNIEYSRVDTRIAIFPQSLHLYFSSCGSSLEHTHVITDNVSSYELDSAGYCLNRMIISANRDFYCMNTSVFTGN